jgi:hypothetical protein
MAKFRTAEPISVIRSSNDAAPDRNSVLRTKQLIISFQGVINKQTFRGEFFSQYAQFHNLFSMIQRIYTSVNAIDTAWQVE